MLDIILKILSILGIILLILLCIIIVLLLLVLFFPVSYKVSGEKTTESLHIKAKIYWLFGLIRGRFFYPEPGKFVLKCLWITLYDSADTKESEEQAEAASKEQAEVKSDKSNTGNTVKSDGKQESVQESDTALTSSEAPDSSITLQTEEPDEGPQKEQESAEYAETVSQEAPAAKGIKAFITAKFEKIKYTILKIYDKIKHIWDNITFYRELLADEQTKGLLQHAWIRLKKILKNIRPRKLKANVVFGADSPDTTGYVLAIYGMLSPMLGKHINITSDFTQAIFLGDFYAAGHITIFQVLFHSLMVVFDKRLKLLRDKLKRHRNQMN